MSSFDLPPIPYLKDSRKIHKLEHKDTKTTYPLYLAPDSK